MAQDIRVAAIGECMVELQERPDGGITQSFGGDTFNTAAYMARLGEGLGAFVDYVSALGDDPFSDAMAAFWRAQGSTTAWCCAVRDAVPVSISSRPTPLASAASSTGAVRPPCARRC